jgi:hypothetical protein
MAKKKKSKKGKGKSKGMMGLNFMRLLGMGGGVFGDAQLNKLIPDTIDKRLVGAGKIILGDILPKQVQIGQADLLEGAGQGLSAMGWQQLLTEMGAMSGVGALSDDDVLAVAVEGIDDIDTDSPSRRTEEDELGEDVLGEDVLGADDDINVVNGDDDINVVNDGEEDFDY